MEYSNRVRQILNILDINQSDLAKKLGTSRGVISEFSSGTREPSKDFLLGISKLGVSIDWFLTGEGPPFVKSGIGTAAGYAPPGAKIDPGDLVEGRENSQSIANLTVTPVIQKVPLIRQKVSCGPGATWETEDNIEEYLQIETLIPRLSLGHLCAMKSVGSSMLGVGIHSGDYLLFDASDAQNIHDGLYVFALDGELYCKRLEFDNLAKTIKIFSMRSADLEKAELIQTLNIKDTDFDGRFRIFGRVTSWIHINKQEE